MFLKINFNSYSFMKNLSVFVLLVVFMLTACKDSGEGEEVKITNGDFEEMAYSSFGDEIVAQKSLSALEMEERYRDLKPGDTVEVKFATTINDVCKNKGCWMKVDLPEEEDVMVKFKDYGFFVPEDVEKKEVIVSGKAFVEEVSVEEQRHFAEDAGKTAEEVAAISEPKRTLSFVANGVLIRE